MSWIRELPNEFASSSGGSANLGFLERSAGDTSPCGSAAPPRIAGNPPKIQKPKTGPRTQQLIHELGGWAGCLGSRELPKKFASSWDGGADPQKRRVCFASGDLGFASGAWFRQKPRSPHIHELRSAPISHENSRLTRGSSAETLHFKQFDSLVEVMIRLVV